jgi:hypothetical protein
MRITTVTQGPRRRILSHVVDLVGCAPWHVTRDWSAEELGVQLLENAAAHDQHEEAVRKMLRRLFKGWLGVRRACDLPHKLQRLQTC